MIVQLIGAKRKQHSSVVRSMRLNVIDLTPDQQYMPTSNNEVKTKPLPSLSRRKSLFEVYKQTHKRERKHKFSRTDTEGSEKVVEATCGENCRFSPDKVNPQQNTYDSLKKTTKLEPRNLLTGCYNFEGRLERIRRRILGMRIPCIQIRRLNQSDSEFYEPQHSRMKSLEAKNQSYVPRKPPVVGHMTASTKFMAVTLQEKSIELTPWNLPQVHSRLFESNEFDD